MLLPTLVANGASTAASSMLAAPPVVHVLPSVLLAAEVPGPQLVDVFYIGGVFAVAAFGGRQVFDSL